MNKMNNNQDYINLIKKAKEKLRDDEYESTHAYCDSEKDAMTIVLSVYNIGITPAHIVLKKLVEWAIDEGYEEVVEKIIDLKVAKGLLN